MRRTLDSLRSIKELGADKPHGTRLRYMWGCNCLHCRMANSNYETGRARKRRAGNTNGIVDAGLAREHILDLSKKGVGFKMVAAATGVSSTIVWGIRQGTRPRARASTIRRILAVTTDARGDATNVDAGPTWTKLKKLLKEGYTQQQLAVMLGSKARTPSLQIKKKKVTVKTQARVAALYQRLMG